MPTISITAPQAADAVGRFACGGTDVVTASAPSNWWSGMAGVPFAEPAEE